MLGFWTEVQAQQSSVSTIELGPPLFHIQDKQQQPTGERFTSISSQGHDALTLRLLEWGCQLSQDRNCEGIKKGPLAQSTYKCICFGVFEFWDKISFSSSGWLY